MSATIETQRLAADADGLAAAAALLRDGQAVAFPTETVYGLGADATNGRAVAAIYEAKSRPSFNPLIVHIAEIDEAERYVQMSDLAKRVANAFWPGPLTLVLPLRDRSPIDPFVAAGQGSLAIRVPAHPLARALLVAADRPVAAPSANRSGRISPTTASHVLGSLDGRISAVLDGGACDVGLESTILDLTGPPRLLRPGGLAAGQIEAITGSLEGSDVTNDTMPSAPGQLSSHYAPRAALRMNATDAEPGEYLLGFGPTKGAAANLSLAGDLTEAAANLFAMLHQADQTGRPIAVSPVPDEGLGRAINDRLRRAAAPR